MRDDIKRESYGIDEEFIMEVYKNKTINQMNNIEIKDYINKELKTEYSESTLRGIGKYTIIGFDIGFERALNEVRGNESNTLVNELEEKRKEFEKEKVKFQDQKREYQAYLRADARFEHLKDTMIKEISKLNNENPLISNFKGESLGDCEASILLSDIHMGLEVDNYWNTYNKKIAVDKINQLKNKIIQYCTRHNVKTLNIELLGDLVNGYIHLGTRISNEEDVISQTMFCSEVLSEFVNELAKNIPNIRIYSATGNHGRCTANIKEAIAVENFERLIPWYMQSRIQSDNVKFIDNKYDDNIIVYNVLNETIFSVHGHQDKPNSIIDDLTKMLKIFPTEIHCGHFHRNMTITDSDIELIVNGSLCSTDEFAKSIRKTNKATQTLIIYNKEGQECKYNIKL